MESSVLTSTFLLTLLLLVGLFFFIRASTKDRIEIIYLKSAQPQEDLLQSIQSYFDQRSYRIAGVNSEQNQVTFEGFVKPSLFLAAFLSALAAIGGLCLTLVLSIAVKGFSPFWFTGALIAPLAGWFYWRGAGRVEQVLLKVDTVAPEAQSPHNLVMLTAHRDEIAEFQRSLALEVVEYE
ncbi:MAG TPA: cofactor assembly of complex C subunit B [Leptolyngbyaceae cyanobacterium M33_DOE_097]|uniref:Cofactor assembly of complex C subunit B n=1 Tax=Oscillatoriales cyanobacterium SpSt-418 TaxID=2282169 RepID=A0A7C3PF89_9CYAN|nr:cofactor assembly of complex C subunit B [Leptolyngbyaceae cyanobacterium M33_DOE_097]